MVGLSGGLVIRTGEADGFAGLRVSSLSALAMYSTLAQHSGATSAGGGVLYVVTEVNAWDGHPA